MYTYTHACIYIFLWKRQLLVYDLTCQEEGEKWTQNNFVLYDNKVSIN